MSNKISLFVLAAAALLCSHTLFSLFADPEGPNLLVVVATAIIIFVLSLLPYLSKLSVTAKFCLAVIIQLVVFTVLYFSLQ